MSLLRIALLLVWTTLIPREAAALLDHTSEPPASATPSLQLQRDVIIAVPSCVAYLDFVHAMRPLRLGVRTFITLESEEAAELQNRLLAQQDPAPAYQEFYAHHPDNPPIKHKTYKLHEGRWLLTPFMAHRHYKGQYKWMLLGDDDTLWLLSGVRQLLLAYDPSLPYWISDSVAEVQELRGEKVPHVMVGHTSSATLCLPCHTPAAVVLELQRSHPEGTAMRSLAWRGCPCTAEQGCAHRYARCQLPDLQGRFSETFVGNGSSCTSPSSAYGGTGMVLSAALMEQLPVEAAQQLAPSLYKWGDYKLAQYIHVNGFSLTFPEASALATGALDNRRYKLFGHNELPNMFQGPSGSLALAACTKQHGQHCNWSVVHAVSAHLRHKGDSSRLGERLRSMAAALGQALEELGQGHEHLQGAGDPLK